MFSSDWQCSNAHDAIRLIFDGIIASLMFRLTKHKISYSSFFGFDLPTIKLSSIYLMLFTPLFIILISFNLDAYINPSFSKI